MQFNPTNKAISLIADIDFLLSGNSSVFNTAYSLDDRTRNINIVWDEAISELYKADPNHKWDDTTNSDLPVATLDLVGSQDHYALLDSALVVHRVRMKNNQGVMTTLSPCLRSELSDSELLSTGSPSKYYKVGGVVFPIPVPNYSAGDGVELEFQRGANYFTSSDTTKEPGFNPQFHQFLSVGASLRYAISNGMEEKVNFLTTEKEKIRNAMREHYQMRSPDERPKFRLVRGNVRRYGLN
jgi:hypothetical protein